ncbi:MAG: glycogen-debranching protein [Parachlamydiaceae bacterium]|nr:glycogen-debranching protein [Parachlamydiaceae bacterium]
MNAHLNLTVIPGKPFPYGATTQNNGINFAVVAKDTEKLSICLFDVNNPTTPFKEFELNPKLNKTGNVWHAILTGLPPNFIYAYRVVPTSNKDTSYLLLDPYAKSVASPSKWGREPNQNDRPYQPMARVFPKNSFDWGEEKFPNIHMKDLVIYEMHVRGFTQHPSSRVEHSGTYRGIIEKIPYLIELGVNAIELMPINEFNECEAPQTNPYTNEKLYNYFGYSTVNFFAPMNRYASDSQNDQAIIEFKTMVRELHKNGIEVILDIVFNHTFEGNEKGPVQSFRGLDRRDYYMIDKDGNYLNFSGCGNTVNCNHPITRELIIDALRYWVTEMHVDGFRFDLASIFTRAENGAPLNNAPVVEAISNDPILANTKLIAEAWDAAGLYQVGGFTPGSTRWSEWNGVYRDVVRRFIKGTSGQKNPFATAIGGSQDLYGNGRAPYCSINFVTAHDGFSLADLVTYNGKHNEVNGEDNRDGFDHNDSWNCGLEGHTSNKKVVNLRERQIRNFMLALIVSQGVPMLLMGDEYGHTRDGNNNTWCQDNELNWFLWDRLDRRPGFLRFYKSLIAFRKSYPLLGRDIFLTEKDITWHGLKAFNPDWQNDNRFLAFTLNLPDKGPDLYVAFNACHVPHTIHIPPPREGTCWYWVVNTQNSPPEDFYDSSQLKRVDDLTFRIAAYSSIMLHARES